MKITRQPVDFNPVTIELTTVDELRWLKDILQEYANTGDFTNPKEFANKMLDALEVASCQ